MTLSEFIKDPKTDRFVVKMQHMMEQRKMGKLNLKFRGADNGFCRVYYKGDVGLYCLQNDGYGGTTDIHLYRCSRDGEPEYRVGMHNVATIDLPTGCSTIEREVAQYLGDQGIKAQLPK